MTEVPEHLLRRSRERREALGLATSGEGSDASSPAPAPPAGAPAEAVAAPAVVAPAAAAPAVVEPEPAAPNSWVTPAALRRNRVPAWAIPVLVALPFWALLYAGIFGNRTAKAGPVDPLVLGAELYKAQACSGCHGSAGEGGVGPALAGGEAKLTFPDEADHVKWVETGSGPFKGKPYGDPNRPGGQRVAQTGLMPAFAGKMSPAEIAAVVKYEREKL